MPAPDFIALFTGPLERLAVPYMITGATAAILYGQPRLTNDLDVVIELRVSDIEHHEGGSPKHVTDIQAILRTSKDAIDHAALQSWIARLGLGSVWTSVQPHE